MKITDNRFDCSARDLKKLPECPETVDGDFSCIGSGLTTLKGCPKSVYNIYVYQNKFKTLEGCPEIVQNEFDCSYNHNLVDISHLPPMTPMIDIQECPNIVVFTKEINNKENELWFWNPTIEVRERIYNWPYYDVVSEDEEGIGVKIKNDNEIFMDSL